MKLRQHRLSEDWVSVDDLSAAALDVKVRAAGWHFICMVDAYSSFSVGTTPESTTSAAVALALKRVMPVFNAAKLSAVRVTKYPGFFVSRVTLHARQIQPHAAVAFEYEWSQPQVRAR